MQRLLMFIFIGFSTFSYSQNSQELDNRNGFKDIKLLSDASTYSGLEFSKELKDKENHAIYKAKKGYYENIGDVEISKITIYTYRNLVYQIEVTTLKDEQLFHSLEKAYGKIRYSVASQISFWEGDKVRLNYKPENGKKLMLSYRAKGINQIISLDKKKAVDSLATKF